MRRHSFTSDSAGSALGVAGIVGFVALTLCSNANVLTRFHIMNTAQAEDSLIGAFPRELAADATSPHGFHSLLGHEGAMPDLDGAIGWLNSTPLSSKSLRGKVVLVNFWTYNRCSIVPARTSPQRLSQTCDSCWHEASRFLCPTPLRT